MQFIKQLQILLLKNIKIIISVLLIISLSSIIFYLDLFNLNFLNKQDIIDLKTELLEEKENLNIEETSNIQEVSNNKNLYKYLIGASCILLFIIIVYYCGDNDQPYIDDKTLNQAFKDSISDLENPAIRKIILETTPKENFVDEVDELRKQLEELAKK